MHPDREQSDSVADHQLRPVTASRVCLVQIEGDPLRSATDVRWADLKDSHDVAVRVREIAARTMDSGSNGSRRRSRGPSR